MRSKWWLILLAFVVVAGNIRISFTEASGQAPKKPRPALPRTADPDDNIVDGYGATAGAARERALENAERKVEQLLLQRFGQTGWMPEPELLSREYLIRYGVVESRGEPKAVPGVDVNDEKAMVARYKVDLTPAYLGEVQRVARQQRVQERHMILARVLGGLVVLLLVVAGYLRLEDMTRGYATTMLRVAALGLLALAGGALWLTV